MKVELEYEKYLTYIFRTKNIDKILTPAYRYQLYESLRKNKCYISFPWVTNASRSLITLLKTYKVFNMDTFVNIHQNSSLMYAYYKYMQEVDRLSKIGKYPNIKTNIQTVSEVEYECRCLQNQYFQLTGVGTFYILSNNINIPYIAYIEVNLYLNQNDSTRFISCLYVSKDFRNQGYGQRILNEIIRLFPDKTYHLDCLKTNQSALHVYKKIGFEIAEGWHTYKPSNLYRLIYKTQ